ncbi:hypothetical protein VB002_02975 [Campylobacter concisus]
MTLKEKIEVIRAYAEGKPVEVYVKSINQWINKSENRWDFEEGKYRIKPNEATKFKVGDRLVYKSDEDYTGGILVFEVTRVTKKSCILDGSMEKTHKFMKEEFIDERDVLWYFEFYDYSTKKYSMHPTRMTMNEMDKEFGAHHDTLSWQPMYHLGFRLKEDN